MNRYLSNPYFLVTTFGAASLGAYWYWRTQCQSQDLDTDEVEEQEPSSSDPLRIIFADTEKLTPGREIKMKLLDPDNGFGKTWSRVREVLAENFPEHQFQDPAKVPANVTILSNQEFDDLRGDHPLPNNTDDWDSYIPPHPVQDAMWTHILTLQGTVPLFTVVSDKNSIGVTFGPEQRYSTTFVVYDSGVPKGAHEIVENLLREALL